MKSLSEWSRNSGSVAECSDGAKFNLAGGEHVQREPDQWGDLLENLISGTQLSSNLAQLYKSSKSQRTQIDEWLKNINQSLVDFEIEFEKQASVAVAETILPWIHGKLIEKAVADICLEFGELAKHHKIEAIKLAAPERLHPLLIERLNGEATISVAQGKEITLHAGYNAIESKIEEIFKRLKALLLT